MREGGRTGRGRFGWTSGGCIDTCATCREVEPTGRKMSVDDVLTSPDATRFTTHKQTECRSKCMRPLDSPSTQG